MLLGDLRGDAQALDSLLRAAREGESRPDSMGTVTVLSPNQIAARTHTSAALARAQSEITIICAPAATATLTSAFAATCDAALLVFGKSVTRTEVRRTVADLDNLGIPLLGIVMAV